ncbi:MAG: response regulator transcription factor [Sedimentibacter sp.]|uniref:response regulator transcription factor n=1 Tax=Sedimentibacter sp. TaxID=1960295 RepID=UPI0031582E0F
MKYILIVEDDKALTNGIALALQNEQIRISQCYDITSAKLKFSDSAFDLLILDINLPDGNGLDLMREVKKKSTISVIMLTANDMETDIVAGLEMGADDYITKPFSLAVLRARVNTQLRKQMPIKSNRFEQGEFVFDFDKMEFFKVSVPIELSKTEQKLLRMLVENKGNTLERGVLVDRIWTDGAEYVDENALSVTIKRLRDKLEDSPTKPQYIKTVYGIGYTWAVK